VKEKPPTYLYKYKPIDQHTINLIAQSEAYFPLAKEFNDPFDCSVVPIPVYSEEDVENHIKFLESSRNYEKLVLNIREKGPLEAFFGKWKDSVEYMKNRTRVFSLTEQKDNPIMFSHYARGHKGLCLEFKYEEIPFFQDLDKVNYPKPEDYPKIRFFQNDPLAFNRNVELVHIHYYTKHEDWKYEREWRIIRQERYEDERICESIKFPEHILTGIIFGHFSSKSDQELIKELVKNREHRPKLMRAVKEERSFRLNILPFDE
jgi:hypothetical protein